MSKRIEYLIIHCTATEVGREVTSEEIRRWHTGAPPQGRGWRQVGYTDMIHLDGKIERLVNNNEDANVDGWEITNGAKGFNTTSRHVVYVGGTRDGLPADTRTPAQKKALKAYVADFRKRFPWVEVVGHNDINPGKSCPCFNVRKEFQC